VNRSWPIHATAPCEVRAPRVHVRFALLFGRSGFTTASKYKFVPPRRFRPLHFEVDSETMLYSNVIVPGVLAGPVAGGVGVADLKIQAVQVPGSSAAAASYWVDILFVFAIAAGYLLVKTLRERSSVATAAEAVTSKEAHIAHDEAPARSPSVDSWRRGANEVSPAAVGQSRLTFRSSAKPRQRPGRAATEQHWKLNQQLCAATTAEQVLQLVGECGGQMNEVNLSTAIHRIAKWSKSQQLDVSEVRATPQWRKLLRLVQSRLSDFTAQGVSNTVWAIGTMRVDYTVDAEFLDAVNDIAKVKIMEFTPQALANTAWACATLRMLRTDLLTEVRRACLASVAAFNPQDLANISWAFGSLGMLDTEFLDGVAQVALPMLGAFKPAEMSNITWAFATAGYYKREIFDRVAQVAIENAQALNSKALANIAWSFATLEVRNDELLTNLLRVSAIKIRWFSPLELANLVWSCARCGGSSRPSLKASSDRFLEAAAVAITRSSDRFSPDDVSNAVWGFATLQYYHAGCMAHLTEAAMHLEDPSPQVLSTIFWAFATLGHKPSALFVSLGETVAMKANQFDIDQIASVVWALSVTGVREPAVLEALANATKGLESNVASRATLKAAFARLSFEHEAVVQL